MLGRTATCDVAHLPADLLIVVTRQGRARQSGRSYGTEPASSGGGQPKASYSTIAAEPKFIVAREQQAWRNS